MDAKLQQPPTLFEVLGVPPSANDARIRRAYLDLSLRFHPNSTTGAASPKAGQACGEFFKTIKNAYDILSDPALHSCYLENMRFGSSAALVAVERLRQGRAVNRRADTLQLYADALNLFPNLSKNSDPPTGESLPGNLEVDSRPSNSMRGSYAHPYARARPSPGSSSFNLLPQYPLGTQQAASNQAPHKPIQGELLLGVTLSTTGFYVYVYLGPGQFVRGPDRPTLLLAVNDGARLVKGMESHKIYEVLAALLEEARQPWSVQTQGSPSMLPLGRVMPSNFREGEALSRHLQNGIPQRESPLNVATSEPNREAWNQAAMNAGRPMVYPSPGGVRRTSASMHLSLSSFVR
ncbi:conserved hypothetical protein [Perkinsus marinus ATCC 50983]|uniref:J domain-containing protein n=1 Tax=Perkinsus marinus (strain ATCC 50983 / TXsc) TaxID=423536 RepID=C5LRN7_PERM5|nr:conserved hypothetical protein [Perkinsus marinus ATCC 50983]EER00596.1 conserved hypothetical protein [Perkinsus marinus ATCC 50983]|eukprot:XP_002767878.1 conserved hypothetical protein [Perkinsus marinus ATCC 50983]